MAALLQIWLLFDDYILRITPNYHWYVVLAFTVIDFVLSFEVLLTSALARMDRRLVRMVGVWSVLVLVSIAADILLGLQLPSNYPNVTVGQAFEYLIFGVNGNPVPFAVPAILVTYCVTVIFSLTPSTGKWFHVDGRPSRRTILAVLMITIFIMAMRPTYLLAQSHFGVAPFEYNTTQLITPPVQHNPIPYNSANRTVYLNLVAVSDRMLPYNFNDTHFGQLVVYVPANWNLKLTFVNEEGFPHNAVFEEANAAQPSVVSSENQILGAIPKDAINGGFLLEGESGTIVLRNISSGTYWVVCGFNYPVPHAEEGMWIVVEVSSSMTQPYYVLNPA